MSIIYQALKDDDVDEEPFERLDDNDKLAHLRQEINLMIMKKGLENQGSVKGEREGIDTRRIRPTVGQES